MTKSNAERQKQWRGRMKAEGYRPLVVWLPQEAMEILTRYPEKERGQVILTALRNTPGNAQVTIPGNNTSNPHVTLPGNATKDTEPSWLHRMDTLERRLEDLTHTVQVLVTNNTQVTTPGNGQIVGQREVADTTLPPVAEITDTITDTITVTNLPEQREEDRQDERTAQDDALHRAPSGLPPARLPLKHRPDLIREARKLKAEGASWKEIARRWNAEGIPTPSGRDKWFDKTVTRMVASGEK